jgi:MFS family permease
MNANGIFAPLRVPIYRRIWSASLLTNFGMLIQGVGAAWVMTQLTGKTTMVALVQTALMLPLMLWSIPAGALADMFDRRKIALAGLAFALVSAAVLWLCAWHGLLTPKIVLAFCFLVGSGMALYSPAWQSSVAEQVPHDTLPQAIALNSISYNIARSFGPAVGGLIVAIFGASGAFLSNAVLYVPLMIVLSLWRRVQVPSRLPPERVDRAVVSGIRYIVHSPSIRVVLIRCFLVGLIGGSISALMPLVARTLLVGGPRIYGLLLGSFGIGAVAGALLVSDTRKHFSGEAAIRGCSIVLGVCMVVVGVSRWTALTAIFLVAAGAMWMLSMALFNVSVQTSSPRWVAGRVLAAYQSSVTGGVALGSWLWGNVAQGYGISVAMYVSGALMLVSPLIGLRLRIPDPNSPLDEAMAAVADPEVSLALTPRSGPIILEMEYRVTPQDARHFYQVMRKIQQARQRNGAYDWSIARDVADSALWTERFRCPTWLDYLRLRARSTQAERELHRVASDYHQGPAPIRVRRMLERPFGSVRWNEDAIDPGLTGVLPIN